DRPVLDRNVVARSVELIDRDPVHHSVIVDAVRKIELADEPRAERAAKGHVGALRAGERTTARVVAVGDADRVAALREAPGLRGRSAWLRRVAADTCRVVARGRERDSSE